MSDINDLLDELWNLYRVMSFRTLFAGTWIQCNTFFEVKIMIKILDQKRFDISVSFIFIQIMES